MTSKRRRRRKLGKLHAAILVRFRSGKAAPLDMAEIKAAARSKRYSRADLLKGADAMKQINADVARARDGAPVGDEIA
jgi:hypothetical protein